MRCYHVLVRGDLSWVSSHLAANEFGALKPAGFYCHRYILAPNRLKAADTALNRVRVNLYSEFGWLRDGLATVQLKAEEITTAPMHKLLKPDSRGHSFYSEE